MKNFKIEKKHLIALGVVAVIAIVIFVWGRYTGKKNPSPKNVQVQVDVQDDRDGTAASYDPTPMVDKLHELLDSWAWSWGAVATERCEVLNELLNLSNTAPVHFMAVVYGYQKKYTTTLTEAIDACWVECFNQTGNTMLQLKERIETLSKVIKVTN